MPNTTLGPSETLQQSPGADSLWGAVSQFLDVVDHAGPVAVVGLIGACTAVVMACILAAPRLAEAWAVAKGGATKRERRLQTENQQLKSDLRSLRDKVTVLEHRDEELRTVVLALAEQFERQLNANGQDTSLLQVLRTALEAEPTLVN